MKTLTKAQQAKRDAIELVFNAGYNACAATVASHVRPVVKVDTEGFTYQQDRRTSFMHYLEREGK